MATVNLRGSFDDKSVMLNGKNLSPEPSLKLMNHSPDGFNWGYGGSGPAQLALAVLVSCFGSEKAIKNYQEFKRKVIANLPQEDFDVEIDMDKFEIL